MIWNLPFSVRCMIIFILLPIIDSIYMHLFDYRLIPTNLKYQLTYFYKLYYYYSWYLLFKTLIIVSFIKIIEYYGNYCYYDNYNYDWLLSILGYFMIGYILLLINIRFKYRIIKWFTIVGITFGLIMSIYNTYHLLSNNITLLNNEFVWQPLLGLSVIYRFIFEIVIIG